MFSKVHSIVLTFVSNNVYRCYDSALRKNVHFVRSQFDMNDRLLVGSPARGVHNGV